MIPVAASLFKWPMAAEAKRINESVEDGAWWLHGNGRAKKYLKRYVDQCVIEERCFFFFFFFF